MTDEPESDEPEEIDGPPAVEFPDPLFLTAPDGTEYVIACEGTLCSLLGVDQVPAYRVTDKGLEFLAEKRRWENVEIDRLPARVVSSRKN